MLYRILHAEAHEDFTVTLSWSDDVTAIVDLAPVIFHGEVFAPLRNPDFFARSMRVPDDRLGLEWPGGVDFSADGLRFRAFPSEAEAEFAGLSDGRAAAD